MRALGIYNHLTFRPPIAQQPQKRWCAVCNASNLLTRANMPTCQHANTLGQAPHPSSLLRARQKGLQHTLEGSRNIFGRLACSLRNQEHEQAH
jgi:hypothetical protein